MLAFLDGDVWNPHLALVALILNRPPPSYQISCLGRGCYLPLLRVCNLPLHGAVRKIGSLDNPSITGKKLQTQARASWAAEQRRRRIRMGYHSESKSREEIREIFREVQSPNVTS